MNYKKQIERRLGSSERQGKREERLTDNDEIVICTIFNMYLRSSFSEKFILKEPKIKIARALVAGEVVINRY